MLKHIPIMVVFTFSTTCFAQQNEIEIIVKTYLKQKPSIEGIKYTPIETDKVITEDEFQSLENTSYISYHGHNLGYGETGGKGVVFYQKKKFPLYESTVIVS
ncbi:hypothetical protein KWG64_25475 (plasmid) [Rahnella sp. PD12R]|uniref:hypothetical protein n=1 Tax=Rahnella sp. PD12R TaxID=2855688 RepID=UPI001C480DCA|nr:hypothetical protein [Rahnella sp. PD12R]MBV6821295.1 hypothetical protein [Rahnella sp. PD12R]